MTDKTFLIGGTIVADDSQRWAFEDVTPAQVRSALSKLDKGKGLTFEISSPGGDVTAGLAIANLIKAAEGAGHPCKAHVVGIAASMASVIACACDEIEIDESAFMMIHNPWTVAQGDADELRKSAEVLDKMSNAIVSFYRSKFDKTDDEIKSLMDEETWFTGKECKDYGFKAAVIANAEPLKAAACARALPGFMKTPENAAGLFILGKHEEQPMTKIKIEVEDAVEETPAENPAETPVEASVAETAEQPTDKPEAPVAAPEAVAEAPAPVEEPKAEMVPLAECEKRVSGMQSAMAKQLDQLRADYEAKLADVRDTAHAAEANFQAQLTAKDEELTTARAEVTRLAETLKKTEGELQEAASALEVKTQALATLNANVNAPARATPTMKDGLAACKTLAERAAFLASGNFTNN